MIISEVLLRSPDSIVSSYAKEIYVQAFLSFDLYCKQVDRIALNSMIEATSLFNRGLEGLLGIFGGEYEYKIRLRTKLSFLPSLSNESYSLRF